MKSTQLQICLLALIAAAFWKLECACALEETKDHDLIKKSESPLFSSAENVRVKRQDNSTSTTTAKPKPPRPHGLFKLVSVLATETKDETRKAFSDIGALFNSQFSDSNRTTTTTTTTTSAPGTQDNSTTTESDEGVTTTTEALRLTREQFMGVLRNNLQGIVRLFRKEVKIALADSSKNVKEFGRDLGLSFRPLIYGKN